MTLVALHGFTQTPAQWAEVFESCSGFWLPGHGPEPERSSRSFEEAVERFLEKARARAQPRVLVGYSMGARLALGALARDASLFERAVLVGVQPGLAPGAEREARRSWEQGLMRLLGDRGLEAFLDEWERLPLFSDQKASAASRAQSSERRRHTAEGLIHALSVLGLAAMPSLWDSLSAISCPIDLVVGTRDAKFLAIAEEMLPLLRAGTLHVVEDSGHNPLVDAPEAASRLLRALAAGTRSL